MRFPPFLRLLLMFLLLLLLAASVHGSTTTPVQQEKPILTDDDLRFIALAGSGHIVTAVDSFLVLNHVLPDSASQILPLLPKEMRAFTLFGRSVIQDMNEQEQPRSPTLTQKDLGGLFGYCRLDSTWYEITFFGYGGVPLSRMICITHVQLPRSVSGPKKSIYD